MNIDDWKKITAIELKQYFLDGLFHKDIAKLYNISSRSVYYKTKEFNLKLERKNKSKIDKTKKDLFYLRKRICKISVQKHMSFLRGYSYRERLLSTSNYRS